MHILADGHGAAALVRLAGIPVEGDLRRVGQPLWQAELGFQDMIHRADDEADRRFGRIPHPPRLAPGRVVGGEKRLVKMKEWVLLTRQAAETLHDPGDVAGLKHARQVVDDPGDAVVEVGPGDVDEQRAQERVRSRQQVQRLLPAERAGSGIMQSRREHAVGDGFSVDIGEFIGLDVMQELFLEGLVVAQELGQARGVFGLDVGGQRLAQNNLDQHGFARHQLG